MFAWCWLWSANNETTIVPATAPLNINNKKKVEAKMQPRARFGGTRQDRHGEWWVLVLADGKWYRSKDVGVKPPAW